MIDEVIRRADLPRYCGLKRSQVDVYIALGKFPRPIKVGDRAVAWLASEVRRWQLERIAERDGEASK
jgi:prophage regulatory protein